MNSTKIAKRHSLFPAISSFHFSILKSNQYLSIFSAVVLVAVVLPFKVHSSILPLGDAIVK